MADYETAEVVLMSKDNTEFKVQFGIAMASETIKALSSFPEEEEDREEWCPPEAPIPLPPVEGAILQKVIEYCTYHHEHKEEKEDATEAWDKEFAAVDDDTLFSLILAANYLDIKPLLDLTCKTVADYIKACKTPQEIRRRFNIKNDFTPEEEEEVRKENAWCEER
jgi:S-phase kinase-associated protein 1